MTNVALLVDNQLNLPILEAGACFGEKGWTGLYLCAGSLYIHLSHKLI